MVSGLLSFVDTIHNIAEELAPIVGMEVSTIVDFLELGCQKMDFNEAVLSFAIRQCEAGRRTAIVTGNMDVFTKIVVPFHNLADRFDVIINSFDYREIDKTILWAKAFELLENGISYNNSLLIEDGANNVRKFRENGGYAYQYKNDNMKPQVKSVLFLGLSLVYSQVRGFYSKGK